MLRSIVVLVLTVFTAVAHAAPRIDPVLTERLAAAAPAERLEVIVSFHGDGPITPAQVAALEALGLNGIYFRALPSAGVLATPAQVDAIASLDGVRSIWFNQRLEYFNGDARGITGVDRLRTDPNLRAPTGLPVSGKGIGIMVNDSGIDANHADLQFGTKTVQNVFGTTNLNSVSGMLPITWIENVPDTDLASGHGTHVAGTAAGTGAFSNGQHAGVARGAHLVGYGSGAVIFALDTMGAFDYALMHHEEYNIRVINNSWGSPSQVGWDFDPDDPTSIATKRLADLNIVVVFAAGNSGSGEDTIGGNFIKAPWVVSVGATNKNSTLADFSSRGSRAGGGEVVVDGEVFTWTNQPTVTAPGVDIISSAAKTDALGVLDLIPGYAVYQGTSMAAPHVAGVVALMLEADPTLHWSEVIRILQDTATNMPGYAPWEVGAGVVNAHAAVAAVMSRNDYGSVQKVNRTYNANVLEDRIPGPEFELFFSPLLLRDIQSFEVGADISTVVAEARVPDNTVAIALYDPNGNRYGSAIALPLIGENLAVTAPAVPGTWTIEVRGIGSVSGVALDPLGLTNGTALPGYVNARVSFIRVAGFDGLDDIEGHPAQGMIEHAVANRMADARSGGVFDPDAPITRAELADYLVTGNAVRQFRPTDGSDSLFDVSGVVLAAAEAVSARGGSLRDFAQSQAPVLPRAAAGSFNPDGTVNRAALAYTLVQALGLEQQAAQVAAALGNDPITVAYDGRRIALADSAQVPAAYRGYVQLALDLEVLGARFSLTQGPFQLQPTVHAHFHPSETVTRAGYAFAAVNYLNRFRQGE